MSVLSRAEVERTTAEVLGWINACNDVVGAIPDSDAFAEFEMAFESDPITIENAFWAGRRLRSFPCSAQIENQSYDDEQSQGWSLTEQAIECLHMIGQDKYIDPQVLDEAICSLY